MNKIPYLHRLAFWYAWSGLRGSQHLWKLARYLITGPKQGVVILPNGFPIIVNDLDWISKSIYEGTYERSLLHFLDSLAFSGEIVDVGANIGVTLWHSIENSSLETRYLACEPSSQCSQGLALTVSQISQNGVIHKLAIGAINEVRKIFGANNDFHSGGASFINHSGLRGNSEVVQVRTLDFLLAESGFTFEVSLLKIDTEGFEADVIAGASALLASNKVEIIIMEVSPNFGSVEYLHVVDQLLGKGYKWYSLDEDGILRRRPKLKSVNLEDSLGFLEQWNLVIVREDIVRRYQSEGHKYFKSFLD